VRSRIISRTSRLAVRTKQLDEQVYEIIEGRKHTIIVADGANLAAAAAVKESWRHKMNKQASTMTMGALLTLVMIIPSFAQGGGHVRHHFRAGANARPNDYNPTAGSDHDDSSGGYGGLSGAIGGIGH
jgi:hypothetical protein